MKKLLLSLVCLVLLCGCGTSSNGYEVKVSDENATLLTVDGQKITKQGYFEHLLNNYGASTLVSEALVKIADTEVKDEKALQELVDDRVEIYEYYADGDLDEFAKGMGYASKDEFIEDALLPDAKQELLRNSYINANFDSIIAEYQVARLKVITFAKESDALAVIEKVDSLDKFNDQMKVYDDDSKDYDIVTKNTNLDIELVNKLAEFNKLTTDGVHPTAIKLSDAMYAVVYIYDTARSDHKEYVDQLTTETELQEKIESHYLKKYGFNVYDQKLKNAVKALSSSYVE